VLKSIVQATITIAIVIFMSTVVRWYAGDVDYIETMVNILAVVVVQDILFGKRK
jgi:hypothetical protein